MLKKVLRDKQDHLPVIFSEASECLQMIVGMEVKELDPGEHIYIMVPALELTCDVMLSSGQTLPKAGLLALVLNLIMQDEDLPAEEAVLGALNRMAVCVGNEPCLFGEPRELLTQVWVWEGYLEYQQLPDSHPVGRVPVGSPGLCGDQQLQIMVCVLRVKQRALRDFPLLSA